MINLNIPQAVDFIYVDCKTTLTVFISLINSTRIPITITITIVNICRYGSIYPQSTDVAITLLLLSQLVKGMNDDYDRHVFTCECYVFSTEADDQIAYAIHTRDFYDLCEISSPGFCTGVCSVEINLPDYFVIYCF